MEIEYEQNIVQQSQDLHKNTSYYNSGLPLSEEAQKILNAQQLITSGGSPQLIQERIKQPEKQIKSIIKYKFMNDGMWMKILIDRNDYPEIKDTPIIAMNAQFQNDGFEFNINVNELVEYALKIPRTREKIVPEKSKIYEKKHYIYIALYKEKEGDWWSLKY
ncbi:unnamed protein product [Paramecium octaurelia]|uniref:Uncharacterized protein n=1 Tax=Paramecium octaurelia TaxID=43137 RepID=A0A8S1T123_PAROT|nr:unnamed protein product [Paramecium octaurelia]